MGGGILVPNKCQGGAIYILVPTKCQDGAIREIIIWCQTSAREVPCIFGAHSVGFGTGSPPVITPHKWKNSLAMVFI